MQQLHDAMTIQNMATLLGRVMSDYYADPAADAVQPFSEQETVLEMLAEVERGHQIREFDQADSPRSPEQELLQTAAPERGEGFAATMNVFEESLLGKSVKTWHPMFFNQMSAGTPAVAVLGAALATMVNATLSTFEAAPVATVVEKITARWLAKLLGMPAGSGGIFLPGGSTSNMLALAVARRRKLDPDVARIGLARATQRGAILCSEESHYSIANAAALLGIGTEQVFRMPTNERGEMRVEGLRTVLGQVTDRGLKPFALVATLGLTVTGGFDPLAELAPICREHDLHLHVDAAFGGGMALTESGRHWFAGIEHADTVTWDAHKWMYVPLTCSVLLTPRPVDLKRTFRVQADYLFHQDDAGEEDLCENLGHFTPLCGRRWDALPLWFLLRTYGAGHFRGLAETRLRLTREFAELIATDPDFSLSYDPVSPVVCFRYLPERLADCPGETLDLVQRRAREAVRRRGVALFNITSFKGRRHFRFILINSLTELGHLKGVLEEIRSAGRTELRRLAEQDATYTFASVS